MKILIFTLMTMKMMISPQDQIILYLGNHGQMEQLRRYLSLIRKNKI